MPVFLPEVRRGFPPVWIGRAKRNSTFRRPNTTTAASLNPCGLDPQCYSTPSDSRREMPGDGRLLATAITRSADSNSVGPRHAAHAILFLP
tara:strand:- start:493 stop:765 length:273 start_codon:yes stop_codon:yes gene_type:complete